MTDANFVSALKVEFEKLAGGGKTALAEVNALKPRVAALEGAKPNATVVQTWSSGASWYRKWSDGWVEQGGLLTATGTWATVSLHVPYRDTNYHVEANYQSDSSYYYGQCTSVKETNFDMKGVKGVTNTWHACGYARDR